MQGLSAVNVRRVRNRRIKLFGSMIVLTLLATLKWIEVIPSDSNFLTKFLMIFLFILTFGWIALFFCSSIWGFLELLGKKHVPGLKWPSPDVKINTKTAILAPVYNEDIRSVGGNVLAIAESLSKEGGAKAFDVFILSDTTNPKLWVEEEKVWLDMQKMMPEGINLYYRRRAKNVARKSGNIEDFCHKWGAYYDFMVVLDADSLLEGKTIMKMVALMQVNENAGIIQAPPMCVNQHSLFARMQQFAGKVYGPVVAAGLAYWQVGDSNYWGHNAIIRVQAFMKCCGLPVLDGKAPFGGHILSHDFVEAALISRGGYNAWLLPELKGSYEECPPTMIDFAVRDRRWCQGNIQHMKILVSRHLNPVSRVHFLIGIMSYLSSPLWLSFLLVGLAIALGKEFFPPVYFTEGKTLFPTWPVFDKLGTIALFIISMFMLIFPKFLGLIVYLKQNRSKSKIGGTFGAVKSVLTEIVFSALMAPIMMMFQSKFVFDVFAGRDAGWKTQNREDASTSLSLAWERHKWHTLLGIATEVIVYFYAYELFWWISPITIGLILSVPLSMLTSRSQAGKWCFDHKFFIIPEEIQEPGILVLARNFKQKLYALEEKYKGIELILHDKVMNALHIFMLPSNGPAPEFVPAVLKQAEIKLENYINHNVALDLSRDEEVALLYDASVLTKASLALQLAMKN